MLQVYLLPFMITFIPRLMVSADNGGSLPNFCLVIEIGLQ
jgi:hypothetical protein